MNNIRQLLRHLRDEGVKISMNKDKLIIDAKVGVLNDFLKSELIKNKEEIISFLTKDKVSKNQRITKRNNSQAPLTFSQQGLWIIDRLQSGSPEYNMPIAFELIGEFDIEVFSLVLSEIVRRHEVLRTVYLEGDNGPSQIVHEAKSVNVSQFDLSSVPLEEIDASLQKLIVEDAGTCFNLEKDVMLRASHISLPNIESTLDKKELEREKSSQKRTVLLFNIHHIASDGWSMEVLTKEFFTLYHAFKLGEVSPLEELEIQYSDYAYWQREILNEEVLGIQFKYWEKKLQQPPILHSLRLDKPRPGDKQFKGKVVSSRLSSDVALSLLRLAKRYQLTPFMLLHSALALVLSRHSNSSDILIGTPVANRMQAGLESLIGFFVNTIVLRVDTRHEFFADYFSHVRRVHLDAQAHQNIPFEQLVDGLKIPRSTQYTPLFQIMMTTNNDFSLHTENEKKTFKLPDVDLSPLSSSDVQAKFDLSIDFSISEAGVGFDWIYDTAIFEYAHIEKLSEHLSNLLVNMMQLEQEPLDCKLSNISMLPKNEIQHLLDELNSTQVDYPKDKCVHELFEQQAQRTPNNIAICNGSQQLTYKELNEKSNQIARNLIEHGQVKPNMLIGLCLQRSIEMVIGILGIIKAGGAYYPIDLALGEEIVRAKLADQAIKTVVVNEDANTEIFCKDTTSINLDQFFEKQENGYSKDNLDLDISSNSLTYALSTSGTTGEPKIIGVAHYSLVNLMKAIIDEDKVLKGSHRVLQFSSIAFDVSFEEIFIALLHGGTSYFLCEQQKYDVIALVDYIKREDISLLILPFSVLNLLCEHCFENNILLPSIKAVISTAEKLKITESLKLFFKNNHKTRLINHFGPTETHVCTTYSLPVDVSEWQYEPPIGQPINNAKCVILAPDRTLSPYGEMGELYISGDCLAKGYINNERLTADRFIVLSVEGSEPSRLYKTGDLVRWNNNELVYCGRADEQVKIRGFRVELGAIESKISIQQGVDSSVVIAADCEQLVGYIKLEKRLDESGKIAFIAELKNKLRQSLPEYMVPNIVIVIDEWTLNINGKIDRKCLPSPDYSVLQSEYKVPETATEKKLVEIWSPLIGIEVDSISASANFFDLGGHSLLIIKLMARIKKEFLVEPTYSTLFNFNTLCEQASSIDSAIIMKKTKKQIEISKSETEWL